MSKLKRLILIGGDTIILYFSLWVALSLRYQKIVTLELWQKHVWPFTVVFLVWLIIFFINRLYDWSAIKTNLQFYTAVVNSLIWCGLIGFIFFYLTTTGIAPKTILILDVIIFGLLFLWWRRWFNKITLNKKFLENIILIGSSPELFDLAQEISQNPHYGLKVIAILKTTQDNQINFDKKFKALDIKSINIKNFIVENKIKKIVIDESIRNYPNEINQLYGSLNLKLTIFDLPSFAEKFTGKILINTIGQMWFLENIKENSKRLYEIIKRLTDMALAGLLLIVSLPFLPIIYLIIKLSSPGPGFFMQQRTGKDGKKFMAVKFRSMCVNSEKDGPQWAQKDDPRITQVGKFLRKSRIDEIPQLINVLRGEMSLIGPRPERPEFIKKLKEKIPFYEARLLVKPGITGWAQINFPYGASEQDALEKLQYDLYYIKNRSLILDISILLKTIKTVLSGGGQ